MREPLLFGFLALLAALAPLCPLRAGESPRVEQTLSEGWRFLRADLPGAESPSLNDSKWKAITLPHTWNIEDAEAGVKTRFHRGIGWYRLRFTPESAWRGRSIFLRFGAAYAIAEIFVNGQPVGRHQGGYSAFCVEITPRLAWGRENVVAVRVDSAEFDGPPIGGDFTKFGGLYRPVTVLALSPLSLNPLDAANSGIQVRQDQVSGQSARLEITAALRNGASASKDASVRCRLLDPDGHEVQTVTGNITLPAASSTPWTGTMLLSKPHLWQGRDDPYLYRLAVEIREGNQVTDTAAEWVGLRSFRVDPEKGFFLNDRPYVLHGVNRHQDFAGKGNAAGPEEMRRDLDLLLELGCTAVRLVHYQQAPEFHALCDQAGLVVWAEPALVNDIEPFSPAFAESARSQLTELIRQNGNHPSICIWGLWNEWTLVKKWRKEPGADEAATRLLAELGRLAKALDPTRLTAAASCESRHLATAKLTDLLGWNSYPGWYAGEPHDLGWILDEVRQKCPGSMIGLSEHGAGAGLSRHADDPPREAPEKGIHTEERQAMVLEGHFAEIDRRPWLWCDFVWQLADCASLMRQEGDHPGFNDKGLVSYDRKTKKDAFYLCKARWSSEPVVHIASRRFTPRPAGKRLVKVYSNCKQVELWINGRSQGLRTSADRIFRWSNMDIHQGENRVRAVGFLDGKTHEDQCTWTGNRPVPSHKVNPLKPNIP